MYIYNVYTVVYTMHYVVATVDHFVRPIYTMQCILIQCTDQPMVAGFQCTENHSPSHICT